MSILQGINLAQQGMTVSQAGLTIVSNNVSNMNTPGYSKQRVDLAQGHFYAEGGRINISGVEVSGITRYRDSFMDKYYRDESSVLSYYQEMLNNATFIQDCMNELSGTGITGALDEYYTAAQNLMNDPTNSVYRADFIQKAAKVAQEFNTKVDTLEDYRKTLVGDIDDPASLEKSQISNDVNTVNQLIDQIAEVNEQIAQSVNMGGDPHALYDQRELLLDELSQYVPVKTEDTPSGEINLYIGDVKILNRHEKLGTLEVVMGDEDNPAKINVVNKDGEPYKVDFQKELGSKGKLAATLEIAGNNPDSFTIKGVIGELDSLAAAFAQSVNEIQQYRSDDGTEASMCLSDDGKSLVLADEPIFVTSDGSADFSAKNITINTEVLNNPNKIATAVGDVDPNNPTQPLNPDAVGNVAGAEKFCNMRNEAIIGGLTSEDKITSIISNVGIETQKITNNEETQYNSLALITTQRESTFGVNLDEELVDLMKYQRSYEASARVFNVMDEILQIITNLANS